MGERVVKVPARLNRISSLLDLNIPKTDLSHYDTCRIDFTSCCFGEPLPMLLLGRELRALVKNNPGKKFLCTTSDSSFRSSADHVGFFRYCGFARGKKLGEASGSSTYVPIQYIDIDELKRASGDRPYAEIVEEKSEQLAMVLLGDVEKSIFVPIRYSIREIMRNSVEHSFGKVMIFFGQYWPQKKQAEIAVFDTGIGISKSLSEAGLVDGLDSFEALKKALEPGVTGVSDAERALQPEATRNSGYGLYVTSRFCSENGTFRVLSSGSALTLSKKSLSKHNWRFEGTCVQMKINTASQNVNGERIVEIIREGEVIAGMSERNKSASTASKSLTIE